MTPPPFPFPRSPTLAFVVFAKKREGRLHRERERERERGGQKEGQTDRQTDRDRHTETDRQTERQTDTGRRKGEGGSGPSCSRVKGRWFDAQGGEDPSLTCRCRGGLSTTEPEDADQNC